MPINIDTPAHFVAENAAKVAESKAQAATDKMQKAKDEYKVGLPCEKKLGHKRYHGLSESPVT